MSSGRVFRFAPTPEHPAKHLFVFLHGCGATAQSMIPIAFKFQARFPSAALVVPSGFNPDARGGAAQDWYPTRGLNPDNHRDRVASVLPDVEDLVRREQTNFGVAASRTVLIAHGSRDPEWSRPFERIAASLAEKLPAVSVGLAFLENGPSLEETATALIARGVGSIRVIPLFLGPGGHVKDDLPRLVASIS